MNVEKVFVVSPLRHGPRSQAAENLVQHTAIFQASAQANVRCLYGFGGFIGHHEWRRKSDSHHSTKTFPQQHQTVRLGGHKPGNTFLRMQYLRQFQSSASRSGRP
jgi:hypothetical protein